MVKKGISFALLAAVLYAINLPFSKLLLDYMPPTLMAGWLYIGAGMGMLVIALIKNAKSFIPTEEKITQADLPYTLAMIILDIAAPIFLMLGLSLSTAANTSLLNNFEIVATAIIALAVFKEKISLRLWSGILFVTLSCFFLSFEDISSFDFSIGSLFVLLACICWGIENNCTMRLSSKDPLQIVILKGIFSGLGSIIIGSCICEHITHWWSIFAVLTVGFAAYGLSIFFYVHAQRILGAARTSAYYAIAPFIGTLLSLVIFRELPHFSYFIALFLMIIGAWLCSSDEKIFKHTPHKETNVTNIGGLPHFPDTSQPTARPASEFIRDSKPKSIPFPDELEAALTCVNFDICNVLVGSLGSKKQFEDNIRKRYYYVPERNFDLSRMPIRYVAIYQSSHLFADGAGIRYFGEVADYRRLQRKKIKFPMRKNNGEEWYYFFKIKKWKMLKNPIDVRYESVYEPKYTNLFLLENCTQSYELFQVHSGEQYRLLYELNRIFNSHQSQSDPPIEPTYRLTNGTLIRFHGESFDILSETGEKLQGISPLISAFRQNPKYYFDILSNQTKQISSKQETEIQYEIR